VTVMSYTYYTPVQLSEKKSTDKARREPRGVAVTAMSPVCVHAPSASQICTGVAVERFIKSHLASRN